MWLGRLLIFALILTLLPLIRRVIVGLVAGLFGSPAGTAARCPRCNGSGWVAADAGMQKACGCGSVPPEARGPIIDVGKRD